MSRFFLLFFLIGFIPIRGFGQHAGNAPGTPSFYENVYVDSLMADRDMPLGEALRGKIPGLWVTRADGNPGAAYEIQIRGGASLRGSRHPLVILDGVMLLSPHMDAPNAWEAVDGTDYQAVQDMLWGVRLGDVESISVLKDASATAIYGSRGADGVIVINTKTGGTRQRDISWVSNVGVSFASKRIDFLSASEYAEYYKLLTGNPFGQGDRQYRNWQDEVFRAAISHNHAFAIRGSLRRTDYSLSLSVGQQQGVVSGTGTTNMGLRANLSQMLSNRIKMGARFAFMRNATSMTQSTFLLGSSSLTGALNAVPFTGSGESAQSWKLDYDDDAVSWRALPEAFFAFNIHKGLDLEVKGGIDYINKVRMRWMGNLIDRGALSNSRAGRSEVSALAYNADALLTYRKTYRDHRFGATAGIQYFGDTNEKMAKYGADFSVTSQRAKGIRFASKSANAIANNVSSSTAAALVDLSYGFGDRYELNAGVRADYLIDYDTQYYPYVQGRWNVSNEKFWGNNPTVSSLCVSAGWGIAGKNEIGSIADIEAYTLGNGTLWIPYEELLYFTPLLRTIRQEVNAGFDLGLFGDRVRVGAKYYNARIEDALSVYNGRPDYIRNEYDLDNALVGQQTITFPDLHWRNTVKMEKWGIEGYIEATPVARKDITWQLGAGFALDRNRIVSTGLAAENLLGSTGRPGFTGASVSGIELLGVTAFVEGSTPGVFYGYRTQGVVGEEHVNQTPPLKGERLRAGDPKFVDLNGNGQIEEQDKTIIGNPNPDVVFSLNSSVTYKRFTFGLLFDGSVGGDVLNLNRVSWDDVSSASNVRTDAFRNRWVSGSVEGKSPAVGAMGMTEISDRMVEDGSFVRLANLSVAYQINVSRIEWLHSLSVSLMASNLFTVSGYSGYSPQVNSFTGQWSLRGIDLGAYPQARTISVGCKAKF